MHCERSEITELLLEWNRGEKDALARLMPLVVEDLHKTAERYLDAEARQVTLQPTALVNEVYLRLVDQRQAQWEHRAQFFGFAARVMRWILVDHARRRLSAKRGVAMTISLEDAGELGEVRDHDLIVLDDALKSLAALDERQSRVVELRFFAGLSTEEIAEVLDVSPRTVRREWRTARLWLRQQMRGPEGPPGGTPP